VGPDAPAAALLPVLGAQPKVTQALLPGNLVYFHAVLPSHRVVRKPKVLVTQANGRLCRLEFNDNSVLHAITVLAGPAGAAEAEADGLLSANINNNAAASPAAAAAADPAAVAAETARITSLCGNFVRLLGLPASYLNRILFRYEQGQLPDLVSFLSAPWTSALFHEDFQALRAHLHDFLLDHRLDMVAIIDRIMHMVAAAEAKPPQTGAAADGDVTASNVVEDSDAASNVDPFLVSQLASLLPLHVRDAVQRATLRFLRQHANHLPAYERPPPFYPGPQANPRLAPSATS
jgi:hypothetical protein